MSLRVFLAFVCFYDICQLCRAGMSCRVNIYSLSGGGSIGTLPGVVPAAWGGLWRARRAVRAAPKTRNCITSRVKKTASGAGVSVFLMPEINCTDSRLYVRAGDEYFELN